jgi:hypothetical protein
MAALSVESRHKNPLKAVPPGYKIVREDYPEHVPTSDDYPAIVIARTRTQLDLISKQVTAELEKDKPDSRRLRDFADAQTRLSEQERILSGRPLPGSRRPAQDRGRASSSWVELQPALPGGPGYATTVPIAQVAPPPMAPDKLPGDVTP